MSTSYCEKHAVTIVGGGRCSYCQAEDVNKKEAKKGQAEKHDRNPK